MEEKAQRLPEIGEQGEKAIEAYLDRLCAVLGDWTSERRLEARHEIRQHIEMLMAREDGQPAEAALHAALAKFGDPATVGKDLRRAERRANFKANIRGQGAPVFAVLVYTAACGSWLMVEMFHMFGWGSDMLLRILVGPLPALVLGWCWGMGKLVNRQQRRGYVLLALIGLLAAAPFPTPDYLVHIDVMTSRGHHFTGSLAGYARLGHVLIWMWIACSTCGLASFFAVRRAVGSRAVTN